MGLSLVMKFFKKVFMGLDLNLHPQSKLIGLYIIFIYLYLYK